MPKSLCHFLFIFLYVVPVNVFGSSSKESSLSVIQALKNDSNKVRQLLAFGTPLEETDTSLCGIVYDEAIQISRQLRDTSLMATSYTYRGILRRHQGYYSRALADFQTSLALWKRLGRALGIGKALSNIGNVYMDLGKNEDALQAYIDAARYIEKQNNPKALSLTYGNISSIFELEGLYDKAIEYGKKAVDVGIQSGDRHAIGSAYQNLSAPYILLWDTINIFNACTKALEYLRGESFNGTVFGAYQNMCSYYIAVKNFNRASLFADSLLIIGRALQNPEKLNLALLLKASVSLEQGKYAETTSLLTESEPYVRRQGSLYFKKEWSEKRSALALAQGNYKDAYMYFWERSIYRDSLRDQEIQKNNLALEAKYQSESRECQIEQLNKEARLRQLSIQQKNIFLGVLIVLLILIVLVVFLFYRNVKRKQQLVIQRDLMQTQKIKELESERQLQAIKGILQGQEEERSRIAKDLHDGLGGLLSGIKFSLTNMKEQLSLTPENVQSFTRNLDLIDNSITELRRVAHNMMPESLLKFGLDMALQDFCNTLNVAGGADIHYESFDMKNYVTNYSRDISVYRIAQELINNALKHSGVKQIIVQLSQNQNKLTLHVEDNGKGFDKNSLQTGKGAGWKNIQSRVDYLKGAIDLQSSTLGTSVTIEINA